MKSGTTWLSNFLASHPEFYHSPVKEMNSFALLFPHNQAYPGYFYGPTPEILLWRMENTILSYGRQSAWFELIYDRRKKLDHIRALAQLNRISCIDDYIQYFEERIGSHQHFGEISPSYAHLPPEAYVSMASLCDDVRFIFLMRDPTRRAVSHIRMLRRLINKDMSLQELLDHVEPSNKIFIKSDYRYTLQTLRSLGFDDRTKFLIYENLFTQECIDSLCDWLGLTRYPANFQKFFNAGVGEDVTTEQFESLRERLSPIYDDLCHDPVTQAATNWLW